MSSRLRILVVEDVPDTADTLAALLQLWRHEAIVAYDGPNALEEASVQPPDVVFLDIGLPGMDGCEVARRLRRMPGMKNALLAAITGHGREADVQRCKEAGIDLHFLKPVEPAELQKVLAEAGSLGREHRPLAC